MASPIPGTKIDPLRNFRFRVDMTGLGTFGIGFSKVTGLSLGDSDTIEYREGDDAISPRKMPGMNKFDTIVFERGLSVSNELEKLRLGVANSLNQFDGIGSDGNAEQFRQEIVIQVIHKSLGLPVKTFTLKKAYVKSLKYGDLDAAGSDVVISTMEVEVENIVIEDLATTANQIIDTVVNADIFGF